MDEKMDKKTWGNGGLYGGETFRIVNSLVLMIVTPIMSLTLWCICAVHGGSIQNLLVAFYRNGFLVEASRIMPSPFDPVALRLIFCYMAIELFFMKYMPGKKFFATVTPTEHIPEYKANGVQSYVATIVVLFISSYFGIFNPAIIYDKMGNLISSMNLFAFMFCAMLTWKGLNYPSTKDCGTNGNIISDFFWGTELYPRIFGFDVKQFTNCRFGMMFWQVGLICYAFKQRELLGGQISSSMLVSVFLQSVYIAKFFWWETGYFCSMDIQHDRAGYYLCWGCMVWVPSFYTIHTFYLVEHPVFLSLPTTLFMLGAGLFFIWCNYDCDRQRQEFRSTNGKAKVWSKEPNYVVGKYTTKDGEVRTNLLLTSGWWGLARHFHYVPEIMGAFFWCVPALFENFVPYLYPVYLCILLTDRAWRDDARCGDKYKESWNEYCTIVPYRIIPGIL